MSLLNFLKTSTVEEVAPSERTGGPGVRKQWNPAPSILAIRVWKDGQVFPSQALVDKFDLEYKNAQITKEAIPLKDGQTEADQKFRNVFEYPEGVGNGFDLIDSRLWQQVAGEGAMLFIVAVPKDAGKVDLFNTVSYDDAGIPKSTVLDQGAATFGENTLIPAISAVYGIKFNGPATGDGPEVTDGVDFVDMAVFEEFGGLNITQKYSKPILLVPKRVTRGKDKDKPTYERRENAKVYGFAPAAEVLGDYQSVQGEEAEAKAGTDAIKAAEKKHAGALVE